MSENLLEDLEVQDLFSLLDSSPPPLFEQVKTLILNDLNTNKESCLLEGLLEYFLSTRSMRCVDILALVREPHDKALLERLSEDVKAGGERRSAALTLLNLLVYRAPVWIYKVAAGQHRVLPAVLAVLRTAPCPGPEAASHLVSALLSLTALLVAFPSVIASTQLPDIFDAFQRVASLNFNGPFPNEYLVVLNEALYSLFHKLYALYPCNFLAFLRSFYGRHDVPQDTYFIFTTVIRPMVDRVRLHPLLVTASKDTEILPIRWKKMENHDILVECNQVCLDPAELSTYRDAWISDSKSREPESSSFTTITESELEEAVELNQTASSVISSLKSENCEDTAKCDARFYCTTHKLTADPADNACHENSHLKEKHDALVIECFSKQLHNLGHQYVSNTSHSHCHWRWASCPNLLSLSPSIGISAADSALKPFSSSANQFLPIPRTSVACQTDLPDSRTSDLLAAYLIQANNIFTLSKSESKVDVLKGQVALYQIQMWFERHKREIHAERNRRLLGKAKRAWALEEENSALKRQTHLQEVRIQELQQTLSNLRAQITSLEKSTRSQETLQLEDLRRITEENTFLKNSLVSLEGTLNQKNVEISNLQREAKDSQGLVTDLRATIESLEAKATSADYYLDQSNRLSRELVLLAEINTSYRARIDALSPPPLLAQNLEEIKKAAHEEINDLKEALDAKSQLYDSCKARLQESEALLKSTSQALKNTKQEMQNIQASYRDALRSKEERFVSVSRICAEQEAHILELQHQLSILQAQRAEERPPAPPPPQYSSNRADNPS